MKKSNIDGWISLGVTLILGILALYLSNITLLIIFGIIFVVMGYITISGLGIIQNNPPHIGVVTQWGKRLWHSSGKVVYLSEGWYWLFLKGFVYQLILVDISKKQKEMEEQVIIAPDKVTVKTKPSIIVTPAMPYLLEYLNNGGYPKILDTLADVVAENLRVWAITRAEDFKTWEDVVRSRGNAVMFILQEITGDKSLNEEQASMVQNGIGDIIIPSLGVSINKISLPEMDPFGDVYLASLEAEKELEQKEGELIETRGDIKRAKVMHEALRDSGDTTITLNECLRYVREDKMIREGRGGIFKGELGDFAKIATIMNGGK